MSRADRQWGYVGRLSVVFSGHFSPRDLVAHLTAYFDKSGDVDKPVMVVAGFIATVNEWDRLERPWKQTMKHYGVNDFHMTDLMDGDGEFAAPSWTQKRKDTFTARLASIIVDHARVSVGGGIEVAKFNAARLGDARQYVGDAYRLCCSDVLIASSNWAMECSKRESMNFVFDRDGKFFSETTMLYHSVTQSPSAVAKFRIGGIAFDDRESAVGLQAADMLANLLFRFRCSRLSDPNAPQHPYLQAISNTKEPLVGRFFNTTQGIERWANLLMQEFERIPKKGRKAIHRAAELARAKNQPRLNVRSA